MRIGQSFLRGLIVLAVLLIFTLGIIWQFAFPTIADLPDDDAEIHGVPPAD